MKTIALIALLILGAGGFVWSMNGSNAAHTILIGDAKARPLGTSLIAVMNITNTGQPDRLLSASLSDSELNGELYSPVDPKGAPIPVGKSSLSLDGAHIRLPGKGYSAGSLVPITLNFERAGKVRVKAQLSDPAKRGGAADYGLIGMGGICVAGPGEPAPAIDLAVAPDGEGWKVSIITDEFEFSKELMGLYHLPGIGHGHLYVGGMKLGRLLEPEARIGALPPGQHEVQVTLNTNDHRAYVVGDEPVTASVMITVD